MRVLYYDCFAGISGDMNLGALVDAGVDPEALANELKKLPLEGWNFAFTRAARGGVWGTMARVQLHGEAAEDKAHRKAHGHAHDHGEAHDHAHESDATPAAHAHRSHADIQAMISHSALSEKVKANALKIFQKLAEAEAQVHNRPVEEVHFHEVGAVDSIVDIVGAAVALECLGVDAVTGSAVELGGGTVRCAHGVLPVPAPATALLAKAFPVKLNGAPHECTTPTGAAILAALGAGFGGPLTGRVCATGIGIGHRDCSTLPNFLRVMVCETDEALCGVPEEALCESAANIDDMTGEQLAALAENLFAAGALDVWQESIFMKKGRLAAKVSALCRPGDLEKIRAAFFTHSTSLGVRTHPVRRAAIGREHFERDSAFGKVRFKRSVFKNIVRVKPEADDCLRIARETGLPVDFIAQKLSHDEHPKN